MWLSMRHAVVIAEVFCWYILEADIEDFVHQWYIWSRIQECHWWSSTLHTAYIFGQHRHFFSTQWLQVYIWMFVCALWLTGNQTIVQFAFAGIDSIFWGVVSDLSGWAARYSDCVLMVGWQQHAGWGLSDAFWSHFPSSRGRCLIGCHLHAPCHRSHRSHWYSSECGGPSHAWLDWSLILTKITHITSLEN